MNRSQREVRLGQVAEVHYGANLPAEQRVPGPYAVYGSNGIVGSHREALTTGTVVVVGRKGSVGTVHLSEGPCWPIDTTFYFEGSGSLDPGWAALMLASRDLGQFREGGAIPGLSRDDLTAVTFCLPAIEEQRRSAAELRAAEAVANSARAALERRATGIQALRRACLSNRILTGADSGWRQWRLGDVVEIQLGKMLSPASKTGARPVPYLRNTNVQWDRLEMSDVYSMDFSEEEEAKFRLQPGDLLVCEGGQPGRAAIWDGEIDRCCYQKALHRLRPIDEAVDPRFLLYRLWLGSLDGEFTNDQAATTISHLPAIRLAEMRVRLPRIDDQRKIAAAVREEFHDLDLLSSANSTARRELDALQAVMLRQWFRETNE